MKIAEKVKEFFHNEGIHSTTIQPEFTEVFLIKKLFKYSKEIVLLLFLVFFNASGSG